MAPAPDPDPYPYPEPDFAMALDPNPNPDLDRAYAFASARAMGPVPDSDPSFSNHITRRLVSTPLARHTCSRISHGYDYSHTSMGPGLGWGMDPGLDSDPDPDPNPDLDPDWYKNSRMRNAVTSVTSKQCGYESSCYMIREDDEAS